MGWINILCFLELLLRMNFLIDPVGRVAKIYEDLKPDAHAEEILSDVKMVNA